MDFTGTTTSGSNSLTLDMTAPQSITANFAAQISQAITFTTNAPASAAYSSQFTVAATGGASGNPVTLSSSGACSNVLGTYHHDQRHGHLLGDCQPGGQHRLLGCNSGNGVSGSTIASGSGYISVTASSVASSIYPNQVDTFDATVTVTGAGPAPAGTGETISFYDAATLIGTGTLSTVDSNDSSTSITITGSKLTLGGNSITAVYVGDANYSQTT